MLKFIQPPDWKAPKGYANGVLATGSTGGIVFTGGQIGWSNEQAFESDDFIAQCEKALGNVVAIVMQAGGQITDIVRLTWYITDKQSYVTRQRELGDAYQRVMDRHFPAMTMVEVSALIEDRALVEIEATAVITSA
ncbi:MAG: enamine deaminase RidA [marine bacterium B5-7]|nr:MAG: enamine deaminase RidA [marine bacterium B5-7]